MAPAFGATPSGGLRARRHLFKPAKTNFVSLSNALLFFIITVSVCDVRGAPGDNPVLAGPIALMANPLGARGNVRLIFYATTNAR